MTIHAPVPSGGDDTAALQGLINGVAAGETLQLQTGSYRVSPVGLRLPRAVILQGTGGTTLYSPANPGTSRIVETIPGASGIRLRNLHLIGDLSTGSGFSIAWRIDSASDVVGEDLVIENCRTDGIYIGGNTPCANVRLTNVSAINCKRSNIAITHADDVRIERSTFTGSLGDPGAGINIEPNPGEYASNIAIYSSILDNNRIGLYTHPAGAGTGRTNENYRVVGSKARNNSYYNMAFNSAKNVLVSDCEATGGLGGINMARCETVVVSTTLISATDKTVLVWDTKDSIWFRNNLSGGLQQTLGPGARGYYLIVP